MDIPQDCESCLQTYCAVYKNQTIPATDCQTFRVALISVLGSALASVCIFFIFCCWFMPRREVLVARSNSSRRQPLGLSSRRRDRSLDLRKRRSKVRTRGRAERRSSQSVSSRPKTLLPSLQTSTTPTVEASQGPYLKIKTIGERSIPRESESILRQSRESINTGDIAFLAPKDSELEGARKSASVTVVVAKRPGGKTPPERKLSPRSPLESRDLRAVRGGRPRRSSR